jgi:ATP-binding cassette subfamily F protein 3
MSLISAADLAKSYGAEDLFERVTLAIPHQARIALVGPNGIGKTTLLRVLIGLERPDGGSVQRARNLRHGYLPQVVEHAAFAGGESQTLWELGLGAFAELRAQESRLATLETEMADPRRAAQALAAYGPLQEAFELAGGYVYLSRLRQVLNGLGFAAEEFDWPLERLSGGERTRARLARLLLEDPDLLILDEPTNHLDLQAIEWFEGWLREWPGAALIVSHDRYLLDRAIDTIWELTDRGIETYRGSYTSYAQQRAERRQFQLDSYRAQQQHVRKEEEYIRRNIAGQNTRQAQGRRKRLERLLHDERLSSPEAQATVHLDFGEAPRSGDQVLVTSNLTIGYPDSPRPLFTAPDLTLTRGECAALIGPNGAGKTTLLKTLLGEVSPWAGQVRIGASVQVGYFAQAHAGLHLERSVLEEVLSADARLRPSQARDLLAQLLFTGEAVFKPVEVLSGGERARLALLTLILEGANLLLLDEPTTHLDIPSQEILQEALAQFPGTILIVSHDRYLIDALATQIWTITPQERSLEVFRGGYAEYVEARRQAAPPPSVEPRPRQRSTQVAPEGPSRRELEAIENRIAELERALADTAKALEAAGSDVEAVRNLGLRYAETENELHRQLAVWEQMEAARNRT